ncbi:MAG TPA: hypothetical protein VHZ25_16705 [Acidobacteriaceae bacterium]|jgi:hypothetical protein|nr:hypothetical protein [Acidobacteriaceae bacterium]
MDLIARYLQAVKFWLPKRQQDDIIAELSEDLRAQLEERESTLGRKLNDLEIEALLRQRGSPLLVANRYLPQQSLIGPLLFPIYVVVLKIVTLISLIPAFVGLIAGIVSRVLGNMVGTGWTPPFAAIAGHFFDGWFSSLAIVTLLFAVLERTPAKTEILEKWNPRKLPPLRPANSIPRSSSIFEISGLLCLLVWWVVAMAPPLRIHLGTFHVSVVSSWSFVYWAVLALSAATTILSITNLLRPWWTTQRAAVRLLLDTAGGAVFCWSLQAHLVQTVTWENSTPEKSAYTVLQLNLWLGRMFPWAVAITVVIAAVGVWRIVKTRRRASARPAMHTALV